MCNIMLDAQRTSLSYENYWIFQFDTLLHPKEDAQITFDSKLNIVWSKILCKAIPYKEFSSSNA